MLCMPSERTSRFGKKSVRSLGILELVLKTPNHVGSIPDFFDIVPVNVHALFEVDTLDGYSL